MHRYAWQASSKGSRSPGAWMCWNEGRGGLKRA
jgi:hypothetical protein